MNQVLRMLLPALLSFSKKDYKKPFLCNLKKYGVYCFLSNAVSMAAVCILHKRTGQSEELFTFQFSLKYLIISCITTIIVTFLSNIISINLSLKKSNESSKKNS